MCIGCQRIKEEANVDPGSAEDETEEQRWNVRVQQRGMIEPGVCVVYWVA
jgi:hypothetical protein